ncbi:MAG: Smr/MutS family protein [Emcibacteraceae bacterium]|nr:Smr/MutS family protein [Emcibacteraceae bacterium]
MTKKGLSNEDQHLWQLYTRDIKSTMGNIVYPEVQGKTASFSLKIPRNNVFENNHSPNVSNYESLKNKDVNWGKKLKQGKAKPDGKIDLHGMTCVEAHEKLFRYLARAQQSSKRVVLVVTGKGGPKKTGYADFRYVDFEDSRGVLRREVPMWLSGGAMRHMIVSFSDARQNDGGSGALYVVLKRI